MALLTFLNAGFDNFSKEHWQDPVNHKIYIAGDIVHDALKWLMVQQAEDGAIGPLTGEFFYSHAIATMALCEAYGMNKIKLHPLKQAAQKAVDYLQRQQSTSTEGNRLLGWRYLPNNQESDTSVTGWCVMAIKAAEFNNLKFSQKSLQGAFDFVQSMTRSQNGLVAYMNLDQAGLQPIPAGVQTTFKNHKASMTAVGMIVRTFVEENLDDPYLQKGANLILQDLPKYDQDNGSNDFYYWYYGSLALYQYDGPDSPRSNNKYWKPWNDALITALLPSQHRKSCLTGSWDANDRWSYAGGRIYTTAINTLTLEVYYRYPNSLLSK